MNRLSYLKSLLDESPQDPFIYFAIAKEYENLGQIPDAIEKYEFLVENHPEYVGTYYHLASLLIVQNETDKALLIYEMGIEKAKEANDAHSASELVAARAILLG